MKAYSKLLAVSTAVLLMGAAGIALAIEAFSERFEEDFSTPKTVLARVVILDPYEDAVWVNWVWKGVRNSGEIDQYWGKMLPGKNMRVFASGKDLEALKSKARPAPGPAASDKVSPGTNSDVVEMVVHEAEQNKRVATNVKDVDDKLWAGTIAVDPARPGASGILVMKAQPNFPEMKDKCGPGTPVPTDVLGAKLPGGSTEYGKHVRFKDYKGC